jgi:GNAT superfamily N-acetyltransferase
LPTLENRTLPPASVTRQAIRVMVREWDPRTASSTEIESLVESINAAVAADLPEDPAWQGDHLREYLTETMPGERRMAWIAEDEPSVPGQPGPVVGHLTILLLGDIGVIELLVHPAARRRGLGRRLLATAARRANQEGFSSLGVEVVGGTPAVPFFQAMGFTQEYVETRSVLQLSTVEWGALGEMARGISAGYRVEFHPGGPPDELLTAYARAKSELRDIEEAELDLRPSSYDPQRLRDSLDCLHRRGMKPYIVLAIHEPTAAPGARRPVRHHRDPAPSGVRHRPRDQVAHALRAAPRGAEAARGTDLERTVQRVHDQGQWRARLPAGPGLVGVRPGRGRAGVRA